MSFINFKDNYLIMKKFVLVLIALFTLSIVNAQDISVGVKAGINYAGTLTSDATYNDYFDAVIAPHFGVVADYALNNDFSVQAELLYSTSGFNRSDTVETLAGDITYDLTGKVNYLTIPIMAKYYFVDGLSLEAGPYVGFLLSAALDGSVELPDLLGGTQEFDKEDMKEDYNTTDIGLGVGASYEMDNGIFVSLRYNLGLTDINAEDLSEIPVTDGALDKDDTIKNNIFQFSVGYKFM